MSIRISASGEDVRRTSSLPQSNALTICGWFYVVNDRAGNFRYFAGIEDATTSSTAYYLLGWTDINTFQIASSAGGQNFSSAPPATTWIYFALVGDGTALWINPANMTINSVSGASVPSMTEAMMSLGNDSYDEWVDCRLASIKVYDANLTQAEILQEMFSIVPRRTASLHIWSPMFPSSGERTRDYSGNGRNWTETGSVSDEDPPPTSYGGPILVLPFVEAAPGLGLVYPGRNHPSKNLLLRL